MKKLLIFLWCHWTLSTVSGQQINIQKVKDKDLTYILNKVSKYEVYESNDYRCSIYFVSNSSGTANQPGTDEVTHNLYIAVSEWGESPPYSLFNVGPFYNPHDIIWDEDNNILKLSSGSKQAPVITSFKISQEKVEMIRDRDSN